MTIKYGQWNFPSWETSDNGYFVTNPSRSTRGIQKQICCLRRTGKDIHGRPMCFLRCKSLCKLIIYWCAVLIGWLCHSLQPFCILLSGRLCFVSFFVFCVPCSGISHFVSVLDSVLYVLYWLHMTITSIHFCTISKQMDPTHWICKNPQVL